MSELLVSERRFCQDASSVPAFLASPTTPNRRILL
jgi:hypothetical protein